MTILSPWKQADSAHPRWPEKPSGNKPKGTQKTTEIRHFHFSLVVKEVLMLWEEKPVELLAAALSSSLSLYNQINYKLLQRFPPMTHDSLSSSLSSSWIPLLSSQYSVQREHAICQNYSAHASICLHPFTSLEPGAFGNLYSGTNEKCR